MNATHGSPASLAALVLAAVFLVGGRIYPSRRSARDLRSLASFGEGLAIAYVIVHVMPELATTREALKSAAAQELRYEGMSIYFFALLGFLAFYGLEHLRAGIAQREGAAGEERSFRIQLAGFGAYACLAAYLLVHHLESTAESTALYTVAIGFHFLALDYALHREHGERYERVGRRVLAGLSILGWALGELVELPHGVLAMLIAFLSGAIVMHSTLIERPSEADARFRPFLAGALLYGLILLPLGG